MSQTTLVTGGTGFIGSVVVGHLARAGQKVLSGTRRLQQSSLPNVTPISCDLDRPVDLAAALKGVTSVVHCAYGDAAAMEDQCGNLLAAMSRNEVSRLIYFSSIAVYGDSTQPSSTDPIRAEDLHGTYARGKAACEALVHAWVKERPGRRAIILRPGIVYGRGSPFWIDKLAERIRTGIWGDFGTLGDGPAPLVHADDVGAVVGAAIDALKKTAPALPDVAIFDVIGPETPSWNTYFQALAEAIAAPPLPKVSRTQLKWRRTMAIPAKLWRRMGLPGGHRAALAATSGELAIFSRQARYDREALKDGLGISPQIGLREGLRQSV